MDRLSKEKRSRIMAAVRSKNTRAEMLVRRYLWAHGVRYRIHSANLPGKPDIALTRYKLAIFINGCFWHGHEGCSRGRLPKTRLEYWKPKIDINKNRDYRIEEELKKKGWKQIVIWECRLRTRKAAMVTLPEVLKTISSVMSKIS